MTRWPLRSFALPAGIRAPGRRLAQVCLSLKNVPGALAKVAGVLASRRVNILSGYIAAFPGREQGHVSFFIDLTDSPSSLDEVKRELKELDVVIEVNAFEPDVPGAIVNTAHFPLKFMGSEAIVIDVEHIGHMFGRLNEIFETGAYVIQYEMGYNAGKSFVEQASKAFDLSVGDLLRVVWSFTMPRGLCMPEIVEWDGEEPRLVVRLRELFVCKPFVGSSKGPMGHFMRGLIAGLIETMTGKEVRVRETRCIAMGDPYCEFIVEGAGSRAE